MRAREPQWADTTTTSWGQPSSVRLTVASRGLLSSAAWAENRLRVRARRRARAKRGAIMDQVCFALPVISGKTEDARAFFKELEGSRKAEFARSEERIGIPKESWYLQQTPMADLLIGYMESPDFA